MTDTLAQLALLFTRTVYLQATVTDGRMRAAEVAPGTPGALKFEIRRVDVNSVSVLALRAALDEHELVRYGRNAAAHASKAAEEADEDGPPPEPEDDEPEDVTLKAIAASVSLHAVLTAGMADPSYTAAESVIHGTVIETALYRAIIHWSPEVADPKAPAGS